jgi:hypothetical protein
MDRTSATAYMTSEYSDIAAAAKLTNTQIAAAYSNALDMSLRLLGYTEDLLSTTDVPQVQIQAYIALMNYFVLRRFLRVFVVQYDVNFADAAFQLSRSQAFKQLQTMLQDAEQECANYGYQVGANTTTITTGRFTLDYLTSGCLSTNDFDTDDVWGGW